MPVWAFRELVTSVFSPPYSRFVAGPEVHHLTRPVTPPSSIGPWRPCDRDRLLSTSCRYVLPCTKSKTTFFFLSRDAARHFEDGQVQRNEDPADHAAHDNHQERVNGIGQVVRRGVDLSLVERCNFPQHGLQGTRLLADRRHLDDHGGEKLRLGHGCAECGAALDGVDDPVDGRRHDRIAHRATHHFQTTDQWNAGTEQGRQRIGEAGHGSLEHERSDDRRLESYGVLPMDALGGAKPSAGTEEDDRGNAKDNIPPVDQIPAHRERDARRHRQGNVQRRQETDKLRQDEDEQAEDDNNAGDDDDQRVAGRTLDLAVQFRLTLEESSHLEQAVAQVARRLARSDHGGIERTEHSRIVVHGCRQGQTRLDLLLEVLRDHAQFLVAYLFACLLY